MRLKALGCAGGIGESRLTTALQIDDDILVDAGSGVGGLDKAALQKIEHVFLTHAHVDHTAFLPLLIDGTFAKRAAPLSVYSAKETVSVLKEHIFNWQNWPDFTQIPSPDSPALTFVTIEIGHVILLGKRRFTAVPAKHSVPAVGYHLDSGEGSLVFTGDTTQCDALWRVVNRIENLRYVIIETAFDDGNHSLAETSGHLCPSMLADELKRLERPAKLYFTHMKPDCEHKIVLEIAAFDRREPLHQLKPGQVIEF